MPDKVLFIRIKLLGSVRIGPLQLLWVLFTLINVEHDRRPHGGLLNKLLDYRCLCPSLLSRATAPLTFDVGCGISSLMAVLTNFCDGVAGHESFVPDLNRSDLAASVIILFFFISEYSRVVKVAFP